jgi:hypothetical protein
MKNAILLSALTIMGAGDLCSAQAARNLRVYSTADNFSAVPNNKMKLVTTGLPRVFMSDADGWYPLTVMASEQVTIALRQKSTSEGTVLGQKFTQVMPDPAPSVHTFNTLMLSQPLLEPVIFDSSRLDVPVQATTHSRWYAYPSSETSSFLFDARVGMLLTSREIEAFEYYYGIDFGEKEYALGLVLEVTEPADLGEEGLEVGIDCKGHGLDSNATADIHHVAVSQGGLGTSDLRVQSASFDPQSESIDLRVGGSLGVGYNLLLVRNGGGSGSYESLAQPESFGPAIVEPAPPLSPGGGKDCNPELPEASDSMGCDPEDKVSDTGCPPGNCGPIACTPPKTVKIGSLLCGTPGQSISYTLSATISSSWTVKGEITFGPAAGGGSDTGGESETGSVSFSNNFGNGNGCGECIQPYMHYVKCTQVCHIHRIHRYRNHQRCKDVTETATCIDTALGTSLPCPRTNCP